MPRYVKEWEIEVDYKEHTISVEDKVFETVVLESELDFSMFIIDLLEAANVLGWLDGIDSAESVKAAAKKVAEKNDGDDTLPSS